MENHLNIRKRIFAGWMHKKGRRAQPDITSLTASLSVLGLSSAGNTWEHSSIRRRFFVLKGTQLMYYANDDQGEPLGVIDLAQCEEVRISADRTAPPDSFDVVYPHRTHTLQPERGFQMWAYALGCAARSRPQWPTLLALTHSRGRSSAQDLRNMRRRRAEQPSSTSATASNVNSEQNSGTEDEDVATGLLKKLSRDLTTFMVGGAAAASETSNNSSPPRRKSGRSIMAREGRESPTAKEIQQEESKLKDAFLGYSRGTRSSLDVARASSFFYVDDDEAETMGSSSLANCPSAGANEETDDSDPGEEDSGFLGLKRPQSAHLLSSNAAEATTQHSRSVSLVDRFGVTHRAEMRDRLLADENCTPAFEQQAFEIGWEIERLCEQFVVHAWRNLSKARFDDSVDKVLRPLLESLLRRTCPASEWGLVHDIFLEKTLEEYRSTYSLGGTYVSRSKEVRYVLRPLLERSLAPDRIPWQTITVPRPAVPRLNVVLICVGSRGDVQPFIALGKALQAPPHCHRVRIATHEKFRSFVTGHELGYYPIAGNPELLMAGCVENANMFSPAFVVNGIGKRPMIRGWFATQYDACTKRDPKAPRGSYRASVIVCNPVSLAHVHLAEKLRIPVHLAFTMPWSKTAAFKSPVFTGREAGPDSIQNELSFEAWDRLMWIGMRDIANSWRTSVGLNAISITAVNDGPELFNTRRIPFTYCYSRHLLPKPNDWGVWIDVSGFWFLEQPDTGYEPPADLLEFLEAGEPPVFVGFGSIVVKDPDALTAMVIDGLKKSGRRGIVQKGWAGGEAKDVPDSIYMIGRAPHDWLFTKCSAVVHHGGAGTTAAGIYAGLPTIIIPFFGDQFFWGRTVKAMGVGTFEPHASLTSDKLAKMINSVLVPKVQEDAKGLGRKIVSENGVERAVASFHRNLPLDTMCCDVFPSQLARYYCEDTGMRCSYDAAAVLALHPDVVIRDYDWVDWTANNNNEFAMHQTTPVIGPELRVLEGKSSKEWSRLVAHGASLEGSQVQTDVMDFVNALSARWESLPLADPLGRVRPRFKQRPKRYLGKYIEGPTAGNRVEGANDAPQASKVSYTAEEWRALHTATNPPPPPASSAAIEMRVADLESALREKDDLLKARQVELSKARAEIEDLTRQLQQRNS